MNNRSNRTVPVKLTAISGPFDNDSRNTIKDKKFSGWSGAQNPMYDSNGKIQLNQLTPKTSLPDVSSPISKSSRGFSTPTGDMRASLTIPGNIIMPTSPLLNDKSPSQLQSPAHVNTPTRRSPRNSPKQSAKSLNKSQTSPNLKANKGFSVKKGKKKRTTLGNFSPLRQNTKDGIHNHPNNPSNSNRPYN